MKRSFSLIIFLLIFAVSFSYAVQEKAKIFIVEEVITIPGSNVTLHLGKEQLVNGEIIRMYEIYRDGRLLRQTEAHYELGLRYAHFDPALDLPEVNSLLLADEDIDLYIVQFVTQPLEEFQWKITELGGTVRHYVAQFAYLVEMDETAAEAVSRLPYVRWMGQYQPAYRLEEYMLENLNDAWSAYPTQRYNIQVLDVTQKAILADKIASIGARVDRPDAGKLLVEATLNPDQLFEVARWNEVLFIDRWGPYEEDMDVVREIGGANYIETVAGYDGSGVSGEAFDSGCTVNHIDFASRPLLLHGAVGGGSHGTATAGVCFGDGTGNAAARGLLPAGQGIVGDYSDPGLTGPGRYTHSGELIQAPYFAVFQTASVGSPRTTQYSTISADADAYCFDFDLVHCQSQSNAGDQMSRPQAWAKNMISGGGLYHYNTLSRTDDMWNYGASTGPASDGRIKPTFTHFYDLVFTTYTTSTTGYGQFSGTSSATPIIAGHAGLFFEMWADGIFGNPVNPGQTVFENRAHSATAKAMLAATAYQYDFTGSTHDKTRTHQGWGMPDLQNMYNMREKIYVIDETDILNPFDVGTHTVTIDPGEPELKIVMVYSDPPGNPAVQAQHRINDLTLKVISPSSVVYWGNNNLYLSPHSLPGGTADDKNTVECVYLLSPEPGDWTIEIHADEIIQDGHTETAELDADYALVVSGIAGGTPPSISIDLIYQSGSPVPAGGGAILFDVFVENQGATPYVFDVWTNVTLPGGSDYTLIEKPDISLAAGATISRSLTQNIPARAPAGNYTYNAYTGTLPSTVYSEDHFDFEKLADGDVINPDNSWNLYGWGEELAGNIPAEFTFFPVYPNPFNPETTISFELGNAGFATLVVYDITGREVARLVDGFRPAKVHEAIFDGSELASGIYFARLTAGDFQQTRKMLLIK